MLKDDIKKGIAKYGWYHAIDLNGEITPGFQPICAEAYRVPQSLQGKRVLDVGSYDGYWAFEALKRGASQVVAIDDWSDRPLLDPNSKQEWDTFDFCKSVLGYTDEQCQRYTMSIYNIESLGRFDVVFMFGVFYHLRHPLLGLEKVSSVCTGEVYIESAICNDFSPYKSGGYEYENNVVMEFYPGSEYGGIRTNWWSPTLVCLKKMIESVGFKNVDAWRFLDPRELKYCRGFCKGEK